MVQYVQGRLDLLSRSPFCLSNALTCSDNLLLLGFGQCGSYLIGGSLRKTPHSHLPGLFGFVEAKQSLLRLLDSFWVEFPC